MTASSESPKSLTGPSQLLGVKRDCLDRSSLQEQVQISAGVSAAAPLQNHRGFKH